MFDSSMPGWKYKLTCASLPDFVRSAFPHDDRLVSSGHFCQPRASSEPMSGPGFDFRFAKRSSFVALASSPTA